MGSVMVPLDGLSVVTITLSVTVWPHVAVQIFTGVPTRDAR